jgi:hypothetical protein
MSPAFLVPETIEMLPRLTTVRKVQTMTVILLSTSVIPGACHATLWASWLSAQDRTVPVRMALLPWISTLMLLASSSALRTNASSIHSTSPVSVTQPLDTVTSIRSAGTAEFHASAHTGGYIRVGPYARDSDLNVVCHCANTVKPAHGVLGLLLLVFTWT